MTPSRGMSDAMRGFDVISREVPPPRIRIDSFTMLLLIGSNLLARGRVGWLPFRRIGLDLGLQAYDGIKMLIGPTESTNSRRVDFICGAMRGTTNNCLRVKIFRSIEDEGDSVVPLLRLQSQINFIPFRREHCLPSNDFHLVLFPRRK